MDGAGRVNQFISSHADNIKPETENCCARKTSNASVAVLEKMLFEKSRLNFQKKVPAKKFIFLF